MKKYLLIASAFVAIASCKKDKKDAAAITKENISGSYVFTSASAKYGGVETDVTNNTAIIPACKKDDTLTLKTDDSFVETDAGQTCTPNGTTTGTWSLTTSTITIGGHTSSIEKFDGHNLQLRDTLTYGGLQATVSSVFTKQ